MIRPIDIRLNAAHPELPLLEAVTFTGSPSTVLIRGVPPNCGRWAITAVFVAASFPDGSTTTRAAVQSANGVWVATLPATATSGRTANGLRVMADGIDENGDAVTGYILGVADFAVASLDVTPAPEPGETSYQMLYFDEVPSTLRKGDVAKIDGVLKFYNGSAWEPFAAPVTLDDAVARTSANGVKSSGIWSAIWGALSALPTGFTSLYDWCVAQLAGKASEAEAEALRTAITVVAPDWVSGSNYAQYDVVKYNGVYYYAKLATSGTTAPSTDTTNWGSLANLAALAHQFLPLTGGTITGTLLSKNTNDANAVVGFLGSDIVHRPNFNGELGPLFRIKWPMGGGTLALLQNLAPNFSTSKTYAVNDLCVYEDLFYRCSTAITTAGAWTGSTNWTPATVEDVLAALRTTLAGKADASAIPYALVTKTISNNAVTLDDRASNAVTVSATLSPNTLTINFPTAPTGKLRDFAMRLNIAAGMTAPEIAWPQGVTLENNGGEVPEIADGGTGGSSTILYFSETENDGTTAKFLVKGEVVTAIS